LKAKGLKERSLRKIVQWANEKKYVEINFKMMSRTINKLVINKKKESFQEL
jgi:hypothetical protein